jgi:hypothetical protein
MGVRNFVRDSKGRFAGGSGGSGGVIRRSRPPAPAPKGGSMTRALKRGQRALYKAEQQRVYSLGGNVAGMRIIRRNVKRGAAATRPTSTAGAGTTNRRVSDALRGTLRELAKSDARYFREVNQAIGQSAPKARVNPSRTTRQRRLKGS